MNTNKPHSLELVSSLALAITVLMAPCDLRAGEPGPTEYFKAGEGMAVTFSFQYHITVKDRLKTKYAELRDRLVNAKAPESVLANFDKHAALMQSLPGPSHMPTGPRKTKKN